jgi:8-oxo-dGTP pyrophosphatase MutT (NUDIX family)
VKAQIAAALRSTRPPADIDRAARDNLPSGIVGRLFTAPLVPAAVLVPLVERPAGLQLLLTRRTEHLRDHPGQISFPGGRLEPRDDGPAAAALRETAEELGIAAGSVTIAGFLPAHAVVTGFAVVPVVGFVAADHALRLDRFEVAETFEVPLAFVLDPVNARSGWREHAGLRWPVWEYDYHGRRIWGATAHIIQSLTRIIAPQAGEHS